MLSLDKAAATYAALKRQDPASPLLERLLEHLEVTIQTGKDDLEKVPASGSVIVAANHPYGILEGAVLSALLARLRPDVKVLANAALAFMPELDGLIIPVDVDKSGPNRKAVREALAHLERGGLLVVFPAGEVAHLRLRTGKVEEPEWKHGLARLIGLAARRNRRPAIVPVHVAGRNGLLFQAAGLVHPRLRTALLARELMNKRRAVVRVSIGSAFTADRVLSLPTDAERTQYLKWRNEILANRDAVKARTRWPLGRRCPSTQRPIAGETPRSLVEADVQALDESCVLAKSGDLAALLATSRQLPHALREIGRLREIAFRAGGEGTGKPLDLDRFDFHYRHLFLWNSAKNEIAGAYRLAITREATRERGIEGLYTATLFRFGVEFLERIGPAIELGRSFIRPEYQRGFSPLLLLWKGIGRFVADHPECKSLFGPVSISNQYQSISRALMIHFLERCGSISGWKDLVRPRHAPRVSKTEEMCRDFDDLSSVVSDLEPGRVGVPVLLRHYVRLGGRLLGFNVDPEFSNALDGLILVDLTETEPKLLERYIGKESAARFLAYHGVEHGAH